MSDFRIGWLFPDTLPLHGERGNVLALARYAEASGLDHEIGKIDFDTKFVPEEHDVIIAGPGEIKVFPEVIDYLKPHKEELANFIEGGHPLIVTGNSIGIFCKEVIRDDGNTKEGLGIIDAELKERDSVYGDDIYFSCRYNGVDMEIIGNEISMGELILGNEKPFGKLIYGYGNTGKDTSEGVSKYNSIFTNTLGPMLVNDPWLTREIVAAAAGASGKAFDEPELSMDIERKSFDVKKKFIFNKETKLTNCKQPI